MVVNMCDCFLIRIMKDVHGPDDIHLKNYP